MERGGKRKRDTALASSQPPLPPRRCRKAPSPLRFAGALQTLRAGQQVCSARGIHFAWTMTTNAGGGMN
jgi:hypothetical protein